jgi:glycosyltransferase involved in cell wall biosynthesis
MPPLDISVIIPTYLREAQLLEAIGSVLQQRDVSFEIIVVDDSAVGSARNAAASLEDPRVHYMLRPEPSGGRPALVRNDGARIARGRYLYFLDDDDLLEPDTLETAGRWLLCFRCSSKTSTCSSNTAAPNSCNPTCWARSTTTNCNYPTSCSRRRRTMQL